MAAVIIPYKPNVQKFREDEFSKGMFDVSAYMWRQQEIETWRLQDDFASSQFFGEFLWDNNAFDLARFFSRDYWSKNYRAILEAMRIAGTYESFLVVLRSALGDAVEVTFEVPNPSHLIIRANPAEYLHQWEALQPSGLREDIYGMHNGELQPLEFSDPSAGLQLNETIKLIEHLNVNGLFIEFVIEE